LPETKAYLFPKQCDCPRYSQTALFSWFSNPSAQGGHFAHPSKSDAWPSGWNVPAGHAI